jgi:hypothetical protein
MAAQKRNQMKEATNWGGLVREMEMPPDYAAYISAAGTGIICLPATLWIYGKFRSRAKRALFGVLTFIICLVIYFVLGAIITVIRPEQAHDIGMAMVQNLKVLVLVLVGVNAVAFSLKSRT